MRSGRRESHDTHTPHAPAKRNHDFLLGPRSARQSRPKTNAHSHESRARRSPRSPIPAFLVDAKYSTFINRTTCQMSEISGPPHTRFLVLVPLWRGRVNANQASCSPQNSSVPAKSFGRMAWVGGWVFGWVWRRFIPSSAITATPRRRFFVSGDVMHLYYTPSPHPALHCSDAVFPPPESRM